MRRLRAAPSLTFACSLLLTGAVRAAGPHSNLECRPGTWFPPGNPSAYLCGEPGGAQPGDECFRWGIRLATGYEFEGRNCI